MKRLRFILLIAALCANACHGQQIRKVFVPGEQVPGMPAGTKFGEVFWPPTINATGSLAFTSRITGPGINEHNDSAIWSDATGELTLVAREGDSLPGVPIGQVLRDLVEAVPRLNSAGQLAFAAAWGPPGNIDRPGSGIWSGQPGAVQPLVVSGGQLPGYPVGTTYLGFDDEFFLTPDGTVVFDGLAPDEGHVQGEGPYINGIWSGSNNAITPLFVKGQQLVDAASGTIYHGDTFGRLSYNSTDHLVVEVGLTGDGVDRTNSESLWFGDASSIELLVRKGDAVPGTSASTTFYSFFANDINSAGQVAFDAVIALPSGLSSFGLWSNRFGPLDAVVVEGEQVPGMPENVSFGDIHSHKLTDSGQIVFAASLAIDGVVVQSENSLWSDVSGELKQIVRSGDPAPGMPAGTSIDGIDGSFAINTIGQLVFKASLKGEDIPPNFYGLWVTDRSDRMRLIASSSDSIHIGSGDVRTIDQLLPGDLNDAGQFTFLARFTDGSAGAFVIDLSYVPEPSTLLLAMALAAMVTTTRSRRKFELSAEDD